jgi:signal transduction histidine kinase
LLDVSKINAGKLVLELEVMDLGDLVYSTVTRLEEQFQNAGCSVSVKDGAPVKGFWDRSKMEQVFTNLLTNALKYGKNSPVEVEIGSHHGKAFISVKDYGMGILPEDQKRIFDRFERAISANSVSGFGLGLFIVRKIIEFHQGTVRVQSEIGKGSTFTVEIPLRVEGASWQTIAS